MVGGENVIFTVMETLDFSLHVPSMGHKVKIEVQVLLYEAPCYKGIWTIKV
jgi:hypothetical protein